MGDRHINIKIENQREKYPNRKSYRGIRRYTLYLTRYNNYWNGTESLSLKDLEIIRDFLSEYIQQEKSRRKSK